MTVILATCTFCGDVSLRPDEVVVTTYPTAELVEFDCPVCDTPMERQCGPKTKAALVAVGVECVQGVPVPDSIIDLLRGLRNSNERVLSSFRCELETVSTVQDLGWTA